VLAGIFLTQVILYGPALVGSKILLPIDCLVQPGVYANLYHAQLDSEAWEIVGTGVNNAR